MKDILTRIVATEKELVQNQAQYTHNQYVRSTHAQQENGASIIRLVRTPMTNAFRNAGKSLL